MRVYKAKNECGQHVHIFLVPNGFPQENCAKLVRKSKYRKFMLQDIKQNLLQAQDRKWSDKEAITGVNIFTHPFQFSIDPDDETIGYIMFENNEGEDTVDMYTNLKRVR